MKYKNKFMLKMITLSVAAAMAASCIPYTEIFAENSTLTSGESEFKSFTDCFLSAYDDIITNGVANGYMSEQSDVNIPYHAVETFYIDEQVDYGHMTTAEDISFYN